MYKKSKVLVAAGLAVSMLGSRSMAVLAQEFPASSEEILIESISEDEGETSEEDTEEISLEETDTDIDGFEERTSEDVDGVSIGKENINEESISEENTNEEIINKERVNEETGLTLSADQLELKKRVTEHAGELDIRGLVEGQDYVPGEVITLAASREQAELIAKAYGGELSDYGYGVATISLASADFSVATAFEMGIEEAGGLPAVVPNYITVIEEPAAPEDDEAADFAEYYGNGWDRSYYDFGFDDPYLNPNNGYGNYQWFHDAIHTYEAWGLTTGNPDVTVAVIDTGVLVNHEDLGGRIILPKDFKLNFDNKDDRAGHGTHVAGIIAANAGNDLGGAGVAPGVSVMAINASAYDSVNNKYIIEDEDLIKAINYVAGTDKSEVSPKRRADIINLSLGSSFYNPFVEQAVKKAHDAGVTIVASMGNSTANNCHYPACYDGVIAVGATDESGDRAFFTSFGPWCDISAPGQDITSTYSTSTKAYKSLFGTSMATPIVSGACALYMSVYGHQDPDTMEKVLKASAGKIPSKGMGAGIVDLAGMFGGDVTPPSITLTKYAKGTKEVVAKASGNTVTVKGTLGAELNVEFATSYLGGKEELNKETKIVYTINGQNPAVKNGVVTTGEVMDYDMWHDAVPSMPATTALKLFFYDYSKPLTVTLKAAFLSGTGVLSKVTTLKFTIVDDSIVGAEDLQQIEITGQGAMIPGSSASFKTVFYENYTHTRTVKARPVDWMLDVEAEAAGAVIDAKGKLTVPAGFARNSIEIRAICKANNKLAGYKSIAILKDKASSVKIYVPSEKKLNDVRVNDKTKSVTKVTLFRSNIDGSGFEDDETRLVIRPEAYNKVGGRIATDSAASYFTYSTSNRNIVKIERDSKNGLFIIQAVSSGTATVTFTAADGSKKKASMKVTVINPASGISLTLPGSQVQNIAYGKKATVRANLGDTYGKPTVKKVAWTYRVGFYNSDYKNTFVSEDTAMAIMKLKAVSFANGKITAGKKAAIDNAMINYSPYGVSDTWGLVFEVTATTTDFTGYSASETFYIDSDRTMMNINNNMLYEMFIEDLEKVMELPIFSYGIDAYEVTSSDPSVVSGYAESDILCLVAHKKGKVTITVKALDGSNMKVKLKVEVK